jgi:hypothetical protein
VNLAGVEESESIECKYESETEEVAENEDSSGESQIITIEAPSMEPTNSEGESGCGFVRRIK